MQFTVEPSNSTMHSVAPLNDHVAYRQLYRTPASSLHGGILRGCAIIPRINAPRMPNRYAALHSVPYHELTMTCVVDAYDAVLYLWNTIFEHIGTYNSYRIPEPGTVLRYFSFNPDNNGPPLSITSSGYSNDANGPFSPNTTPSPNYSTPCFPETRRPSHWHLLPYTRPLPPITPTLPTLTVTQLSSHPPHNPLFKWPSLRSRLFSHSQVENSYGILYQDDNFSVNVQDSRARFHQDYPYSVAHGAEAWTSQLD